MNCIHIIYLVYCVSLICINETIFNHSEEFYNNPPNGSSTRNTEPVHQRYGIVYTVVAKIKPQRAWRIAMNLCAAIMIIAYRI